MKATNSAQKINKIVINSGIGKLASLPNFDEKILPEIVKDFAAITGQRPSSRPSKKSISGFKLRQGMIVGLMATLRGRRAVDFLERLGKIVFPRVRDFRGISDKGIDERGNLTIGIKENVVFPEISQEISKTNFGLQITIVPKAVKNREEATVFYRDLGLRFLKK